MLRIRYIDIYCPTFKLKNLKFLTPLVHIFSNMFKMNTSNKIFNTGFLSLLLLKQDRGFQGQMEESCLQKMWQLCQ